MALEPIISLVLRQGEVERHSIASRIPMVTCHSLIVVKGTGIYTVRHCVYVDAHKVKYTKGDRFPHVNATFQSKRGVRGGRKG